MGVSGLGFAPAAQCLVAELFSPTQRQDSLGSVAFGRREPTKLEERVN